MFTGIVQGYCEVIEVRDEPGLRRLTLALTGLEENLQLGASVAINGTCLTVTQIQDTRVSFDVIAETLSLTNVGALTSGSSVNVERSFRVGDEVGGHIVSGHVTGMAQVVEVNEKQNNRELWFQVPKQCMKFLHLKGFAALDGASLTLSGIRRESAQIAVSLIPETIARTTLGRVVVGDWVNLEVDAQTQSVVETVERVLQDPEWQKQYASNLEG